MRKIYLTLLVACIIISSKAQTTITTSATSNTFWSAAGGALVFGVRNTNTYPIKLTKLSTHCPASHNATYTLWYNTTTLTGLPGAINNQNGWIQLPISYTVPSPAAAGITPIFNNIDLVIPNGSIYRLALIASANGPYYGNSGAGADIFSGAGVDILTQGNTASQTYVGATTGPTSTPRGFLGSLTFEQVLPCTNPITPGTTTSNITNLCAGAFFNLSLSGSNGLGSGTTYQWQRGATASGPWNNINSATSSILTTTQTVTSWYRCELQCSGGTLAHSTPVQITSPTLIPTSNFTINKSFAVSPTNFHTFSEAFNYIKCGISGSITFTVGAGSGPYTEQLEIPQIFGASSTNKIIIKGNNETLTFTPTVATSRHVLWLNGADHITIDSLNVTVGGTVAGWGIVLTNQADSNRISNCTVDVGNPTISTTNFIPLVINGVNNTTASSGNNANHNIFEKNTLKSGYNGVYFYGNSASTTQNVGNIFRNNNILDFHNYGIAATYARAGTIISKNDFSRPTRTASTTTGGVSLNTGCRGVLIEKNKVHNLFDALLSNTSTVYGIYVSADATTGFENKIINNALYAFNGNGSHYGIYNTGGDSMQAYHNTIVMNDAAATGATYGLYQTGAASGISFKNNIVSVTKGGAGIKRCIHFATTTSTISSNNNVLYLNAGGGTDNHLGQFGTTNYTAITNWKTANGNAFDQLSSSFDPSFIDPNNGDLAFTNQSIDAKGENIGIPTDIVDSLRGTAPDPGCYEISFLQNGIDMVTDALVNPAFRLSGCYTNAEAVSIKIKNNSTASINFASNPCTIQVQVSGAASQTISQIINTGTLASDSFLTVNLINTLNLSTVGNYSINATATVVGDVNNANNSLSLPESREKIVLSAGTVTSSPKTFCTFGSIQPTLRATGTTGSSNLKWQTSSTANGTFTDIAGATTNPYTIPTALTQTYYYRGSAICGTETINSSVDSIAYSDPQIVSTTPSYTCGTGTVTLSAAATPGSTISWYAASSGGTALGAGNTYTTPSISTTTTYYTAARGGTNTSDVSKLTYETASSATNLTTYGLDFTLNTSIVLNSVQVFSTTGTSITISLYSANGATQLQTTGAVAVAAGSSPIIPLNFSIAPGTYRLVANGMTGSFYRDNSGVTYPFALGNVGTMNGFVSAITGTVTTSAAYYFMYKWNISTSCESARTPVVATVDNTPGCTPLPVFLLQFSGKKEGETNKLQFTSANEINNKGFFVERSIDGYKFSTIGYVASKAVNGFSTSNLAYTFIDEKPFSGNKYYRLKQEDKDGKTTLSNIVAIKGTLSNKLEIESVYPNPSKSQITVQLNSPFNEKVSLIITDLQGKIVNQQNIVIPAGHNNVNLNINNLSAGNYFIKAICNNGCTTTVHKFVKM